MGLHRFKLAFSLVDKMNVRPAREFNVPGINRWGIAVAGFLLQMTLGSVYAWSVFKAPLTRQFHWATSDVTFAFTVAIFTLGIAAFVGGFWMNRIGPRPVAMMGGFFYGLGVFLASFSTHGLGWLYLTFGLIGGVGLGFGYIVPVAVLVRWFPDRRGFITGLAVCGFGAGALVTAPLAVRLIQAVGVLRTFGWLGIGFLVLGVASGFFMKDPPADYCPAGWTPSLRVARQRTEHSWTLYEALGSWQWWALWLLLFLNTSAGISLISQESPVFTELTGASAIIAAAMVGVASVGNAAGRFFWAGASDIITRRWTFVSMFALQIGLFWMLPQFKASWVVAMIAFLILMCYGGGFGTMPAFVADYFGDANVGPIYGLMLTAWGAASVFGPMLTATLHDSSGSYRSGLHIIAAMMAVSVVLPILVRPPRVRSASVSWSPPSVESEL